MKSPRPLLVLAAAAVLGTAATFAAYAKGGFAFTKRVDTALLAEPSPLAAAAAKLKLGTKLTITEVKGAWLHAEAGAKQAGWIFSGNVSATAPDENAGVALVPFDASATTATAAARPLAPAAADYGSRRDLGRAQDDLVWLMEENAKVTTAEVTAYLQAQKKGEFQ